MAALVFLYDVEFVPGENPPGVKERFDRDLRAFLDARGWDWGMSALGGMARTRGTIWGRESAVELDRRRLATWLAAQPIRAVARLGALEEDTVATEYFREIAEWVFPIDNRPPLDRGS